MDTVIVCRVCGLHRWLDSLDNEDDSICEQCIEEDDGKNKTGEEI